MSTTMIVIKGKRHVLSMKKVLRKYVVTIQQFGAGSPTPVMKWFETEEEAKKEYGDIAFEFRDNKRNETSK